MFYQQLLLNSKLRKDLSAYLGSIYFSAANCNDCLPGEFNRKEFLCLALVRIEEITRKQIGKNYFCGSQADVLWACSEGAAGVGVSEILSFALQSFDM